LGLSSLSRFTFTNEQSDFIKNFLYHNHRDIYNKLMIDHNGVSDKPMWWKQDNTKKFRDLLRNAN
jgi:hypothetical protein